MALHNHVWRDDMFGAIKSSKEELLKSIRNSGTVGYWLRDKEVEWGRELNVAGKVTLCCNGGAAIIKWG